MTALLPLIVISVTAILVMLATAIRRHHAVAALLTLAGLAVAFVSLWPAASLVPRQVTPLLVVDGYALFYTGLILAAAFVVVILSYGYFARQKEHREELYILLLVAVLGAAVLVASDHFVSFLLGLELLSIALYALNAYLRERTLPLEAGIKYLILAAASAAFLLFGMALIYAELGTMEFSRIAALVFSGADVSRPILLAGVALLITGFGFKLALVPFHLWTPDVYQGAPAPITAFLSTGSKVALFAALLRFSWLTAAPVWAYCLPALWGLAVLTMVVGNVTALYQTQIKRLLAYSSIGQMGYLFMALLTVKQGGLPALIFYLVVYAVMDLGAFGLIGTLSPATAKPDLDDLTDYQGLGYSQPWRAGLLAICLIALAGLPPTAGFMGKFALFRAVLHADYLVLAIIGILTAIISLYYYFKVSVFLFMRLEGRETVLPRFDLSVGLAGIVILTLILWLGMVPSAIFNLVERIAATLSLHS
jgi:NADH-quinone oxidoreductase subunit N